MVVNRYLSAEIVPLPGSGLYRDQELGRTIGGFSPLGVLSGWPSGLRHARPRPHRWGILQGERRVLRCTAEAKS